ncbi:MAG: flagellar FlbD family protein [Planctomycetota bacterium]
MIALTLLNGERLLLNPVQFERIDAVPDTQVTMMNGHRYFVQEQPDAICEAVQDWLRGSGVAGSLGRFRPQDGEG